jgi:hypothetical protein
MEFTLSFHTIKEHSFLYFGSRGVISNLLQTREPSIRKLCGLKEPWSRLRNLSDTAYMAGRLRDRDSSVSIVTKLQTVNSAGFGSCQVQEIYLFSKTLKPTQLLIQKMPELFPRWGVGGLGLTSHLRLVSRLIMSAVKPPSTHMWYSGADRKKFHGLDNRRPTPRFSAGEKAFFSLKTVPIP